MSLPNFLKKFVLSALLFCYPFAIYALERDSREKIIITSNESVHNFKTGFDIYTGNVKIQQGTSHLQGDKIITKRNAQHTISEIIAYGFKHPAKFQTIPKLNQATIYADAKIIKFYPIQSTVTLLQNVAIKQGQNIFHGEKIYFDKNKEIITIPASEQGQAIIVYNSDS